MSKKNAEIIDKWIYALLNCDNSKAIKGRIRFTKEFFLVAAKYIPKLYNIADFYLHHFGPYSTLFGVRMNHLKNETKHIQAIYKNGDWSYSLTEEGKKEAKKQISDIPAELLNNIGDIKRKNEKLSLKELLKEIYINYSDFAVRAAFREDIVVEKVKLKDLPVIDDGPGLVVPFLSEEEVVLEGEAASNFLKILSE